MGHPDGMTMKKVTVSLPQDVAEGVQALVDGGTSPSFSAFVATATKAQLDRDAALAQLRAHTGGPRGGALRARAEQALGIESAADRKAS
jgi:Arc/MetJ-type ribon-helix-helix transcriptional regulator